MKANKWQRRIAGGRTLVTVVAVLSLGLFASACSTGAPVGSDVSDSTEPTLEVESAPTSSSESVDSTTKVDTSEPAAVNDSASGDTVDSPESGFLAVSNPDDYPAEVIYDLATGEEVALASLVDGSLPTLLWFWAPH